MRIQGKLSRIIQFSLFVVLFNIYSCTGCSSQSSRGHTRNKDREEPSEIKTHASTEETHRAANRDISNKKTIVSMRAENGVYKIPVLINGSEMDFIFDTGAGLISISAVEASFLYKQGKISEEDIVGKANFVDANGDISEGTIINLKEVTIGNRTIYDVQASVVNNLVAPLLLGQSALQKFGRVSIDYVSNQIVFE